MHRKLSPSLFVIGLLLPVSANAESGPLGWGQEELTQELETDRPDFTEGTQTVQPGHFQVELGYTFTTDNEEIDIDAHSAPELLLRVGLLDDLEFRLAWEGYLREETDVDETDGVSDMSVGFKHRMYYQDGLLPDFSFLGELGLPVGSSEFTSDELEAAGKFLWAYGFESYSVAGNINFGTPVGVEERYLEFSTSAALGASLSDAIGIYGEYFAFFPVEDVAETTEQYLNGGFTFGLSENTQLDVRAGFGLNEAADDFFTGAGLAFRI